MFERFTHQARRVVVLAHEEARLLNHNWIGTEHLLLGLIKESEGVAAKALEELGVGLETIRGDVRAMLRPGKNALSGHIPFTPRAKKVLELSLREALQLGHNYIGTEHILLGLVREGQGVASQVLAKLGADAARTRQVVLQLLSGHRQPGAEGQPEVMRAAVPPGAAIGSTHPAEEGGRAPEFVGAVAIGRQFEVEAGQRLVLLALEVWSGWFDLRYAAVPAPGAKDPPASALRGLETWKVTDDAGTRYRCTGIAAGRYPYLHVYQASYQPAPPRGAHSLTLALTTDSGDTLTTTVPLDWADSGETKTGETGGAAE
jgi:hypothetical protein